MSAPAHASWTDEAGCGRIIGGVCEFADAFDPTLDGLEAPVDALLESSPVLCGLHGLETPCSACGEGGQ